MSMVHRVAVKIVWTKNPWIDRWEWPPVYPTLVQLEGYKQWCKDRVGTNGWNYYGYYRKVPCEFRFKRSEDLVAFKLTFGL